MTLCDDLNEHLPIEICYNPNQHQFLWETAEELLCTACAVTVPEGTLPANFRCVGFPNGFPSAEICPTLTVIEGCNIWIAPNDPVNCSIGTCPATTATDWVLLENQPPDAVATAPVLLVHSNPFMSYVVTGAYAYAPMQTFLIHNTTYGTYNNAGVSRWTCNLSGYYRGAFNTVMALNKTGVTPPGWVSALGLSPAIYLNGGGMPGITSSIGWGANTPVPEETVYPVVQSQVSVTWFAYIFAGQYIDWGGVAGGDLTYYANSGILATSQNTGYMLIEKVF